jgi:hypothetical protein
MLSKDIAEGIMFLKASLANFFSSAILLKLVQSL